MSALNASAGLARFDEVEKVPGHQRADNLPRFIDGFEPPKEPKKDEEDSAGQEDEGELELPETPLELPDMTGVEVTIETSGKFFIDRASPAETKGSMHTPPVRRAESASTPAPVAAPAKTAAAPRPRPSQPVKPESASSKAIKSLLDTVYTRWFDDLIDLKSEGKIAAGVRSLAQVAAAVTVLDMASMLHDFGSGEYVAEREESVEATRAALVKRLRALQPTLDEGDVQQRVDGLATAVEGGTSSVRQKCLWQALSSSLDVGFTMDMYFHYCESLVDRLRVALAAETR